MRASFTVYRLHLSIFMRFGLFDFVLEWWLGWYWRSLGATAVGHKLSEKGWPNDHNSCWTQVQWGRLTKRPQNLKKIVESYKMIPMLCTSKKFEHLNRLSKFKIFSESSVTNGRNHTSAALPSVYAKAILLFIYSREYSSAAYMYNPAFPSNL